MVECAGLENRYGCKLIVGSNPTPSATPLETKGFRRFTLRHIPHSEAIVSHMCGPTQRA
ncbi:hypothetical protein MCP1_10140 [Candidatus Terasakiella magnetica]|nr:hypothetical protein MCP1_10140 [Candidatus Terasakiella magnetica]